MPSFAENGREDHIQNFAISFDQTRQGKIFLVEPHAMPYKSRFACCSVCCSCSTSLLLGYVDVIVFKLVCPRTKQKERIEFTIMFSSSIFYREDEKADLVIEENTSHSSSSISSKSSNSSDRYGSSFAQP